MEASRAERLLVVLIILHSVAVGLALLAVPEWALRFGGWAETGPSFFPRQAGVFHFLLALGYGLEFFRCRTVTLLVAAKATAFVFLSAATVLLWPPPWIVPFSAATDGLMGLAVVLLHRRAGR
jgi:hypothetical protein